MNEASLQLFEEKRRLHRGSPERALAETIQYIALLGLSRTDFFSVAAFYGGTALRVLYGLDRFSEDLDFSLLVPQPDFHIEVYLAAVADELTSYGFIVEVGRREKRAASPIESAFIKANTRIHIVETQVPASFLDRVPGNALCKVKLEVDTDPPDGAAYSGHYIDDPTPFSIRAFDGPSLFAGKLAAVLARAWKNRVKGRDWYDFAFLVRKRVPVSLRHLDARLRQVGYHTGDAALDGAALIGYLGDRIASVDFEQAKSDVIRFIGNPADLDIWSAEYFTHVLSGLEFI